MKKILQLSCIALCSMTMNCYATTHQGLKISNQDLTNIIGGQHIKLAHVRNIIGQANVTDTDIDGNIVEYYISRTLTLNTNKCIKQEIIIMRYDDQERLIEAKHSINTHNNISIDSRATKFNIQEPGVIKQLFISTFLGLTEQSKSDNNVDIISQDNKEEI